MANTQPTIYAKILLSMFAVGILYMLVGGIYGRAHLSTHYLITRAAVTGNMRILIEY